MRQLGKSALQRVGVKLGGIERARGQFGAVIEREGPWEVRIETPGIVKGWVTRVRPQQGRRFGVTRGTWKRGNPSTEVSSDKGQRSLKIQHLRILTNYAQQY